MVDLDVFDRRLARLEDLVRSLRKLASVERSRYMRDRGLQAQAERWLQLAGECVIDLAHHLISDRGWRMPASYREAFTVLREEGVLSAEQEDQMAGWASLRNVLVHLYLEVDQEILYEIIQGELDQLVDYASAMQDVVAGEK